MDFNAKTNNTFKFSVIYYTDSDQTTPVDLTLYTVDMDIKDSTGTVVASNVATKKSPNTSGQIDISVPYATTATWPLETLVYDLCILKAGEKMSILDGAIYVTAGVTA
jgi:hypothetical protein